jgi:hypothetical protein
MNLADAVNRARRHGWTILNAQSHWVSLMLARRGQIISVIRLWIDGKHETVK